MKYPPTRQPSLLPSLPHSIFSPLSCTKLPSTTFSTSSNRMTDRDPTIIFPQPTSSMSGNQRLDPAASSYSPALLPQKMPSQMSAPPSPYLESRISNLEEEHSNLREEVDSLTELYHSLGSSLDKLKKGGWPVSIGPFQEKDPARSNQGALKFKRELDELTREVHMSVDGVADMDRANGTATSKTNGSMPPHIRGATGNGAGSKSLPPHLRGKNTNG